MDGGCRQTTNRREELNNSSSSIRLQSFSTIIPEANVSSNMHHDFPMKGSLAIRPPAKKEHSLMFAESDLNMVSLGRHTTYASGPCEPINRSKSIMMLDSECTSKKKQKTIVTSLFCTTCSK